MFQKKKHRKYRNKKTDKGKKELERIKNERIEALNEIKKKVELENLDTMLFLLPLDLKIIIFQMAVYSNMNNWKIGHIDPLYRCIKKWDEQVGYENDDGDLVLDYIDHPGNLNIYLKKQNRICITCVRKKEQPNIRSIYIPSNVYIPECIKYREWSNIPNKYWVHKKCRCRDCDLIRITGYTSLDNNNKKKYARVEMDEDSKQWKTKTVTQLKPEKEAIRNKRRNHRSRGEVAGPGMWFAQHITFSQYINSVQDNPVTFPG